MPDLPLVMLSSVGQTIDVRKNLLVAYLTKPAKQAELGGALAKALATQPQKKPLLAKASRSRSDTTTKGGLRILVAEDNVINQQVAARLLGLLGYEATVVGNGLEALEALRMARYDLVLMDLRMPVMGGLDATERIVNDWPKEERPRVIALTADVTQESRERCLAAGMEGFITKPITQEDLAEALSGYTGVPA